MNDSRWAMFRTALVLAGLVTLVLATGAPAQAQSKSKTKMSDGKLMALDHKAGTMTVKEKGNAVVYQVVFEGSVMNRTTATMNAKPVKLDDIPLNAPVIVYWKPDPNDRKLRNARKVDAPKVADEFLEEYE